MSKKRKRAAWEIRRDALKPFVDLRQYPGLLQGKPTKAAKDKLRRHAKAIGDYRKHHPEAYVYRPRSMAKAREIQAQAHPEIREYLPRIKSLKVAFLPDVAPGTIRDIRMRDGRLVVKRTDDGVTYEDERWKLSARERRRFAQDPEAILRELDMMTGARDLIRIDLVSGGAVGSGKRTTWSMEYSPEDIGEAIRNLVKKYGKKRVEQFLSGFTISRT